MVHVGNGFCCQGNTRDKQRTESVGGRKCGSDPHPKVSRGGGGGELVHEKH